MLEILLVLAFVFGAVYLGALDLSIPSLDKIVQKLGWQDEPRTNDNLGSGMESLIDSSATVKSSFSSPANGLPFEGRVSVRGTEWKAEQISGDTPLDCGDKVIVRRTEGTKLFVEASGGSGV